MVMGVRSLNVSPKRFRPYGIQWAVSLVDLLQLLTQAAVVQTIDVVLLHNAVDLAVGTANDSPFALVAGGFVDG